MMWTMYSAPSDRDYAEQFCEREDEDPTNEPAPSDPATPDMQLTDEECPFGEGNAIRIQAPIRSDGPRRQQDSHHSRVA